MAFCGVQEQKRASLPKGLLTSRITLGCSGNICRLRAFWTLGYLKLYLVTFLQALIAFGRDGAVMHEHIGSSVTSDEAITFGVVEPFHRAFQTFHFAPPRARAWSEDVPCPLMPFCGHADGLSSIRRAVGTVVPQRRPDPGFWPSQRMPQIVLASRITPFFTHSRAFPRGRNFRSKTSSSSGCATPDSRSWAR